MRRFIITELVLYLAAATALYLASFFHFFGPSMWYEGAIPESWMITTKFVAAYVIFILLYIFLSLRIKGRLLATATTTISVGILLPWIGYSILSVLDIASSGNSITQYVSWLMSFLSAVFLLTLILIGRNFMLSGVKGSK